MTSALAKISMIAACCTLAACSTLTVTTDYDHAAPFGKYKTYTLAPAPKDQTLSPASEATSAGRSSCAPSSAKRGITEVTNGKPDLAIVRHVLLAHNVTVEQYTDWGYAHGAWPYGYGHYGMWAGAPQTYVDVSHYLEGTLILDAVDLHTKKLVFRGTGTDVVSGPESNAEKIREAVKKMVDALPK